MTNTPKPQANTVEEIFGELLAEGMEQGCVTDINGEAMISHQYVIGYLEPKIQALITEARIDTAKHIMLNCKDKREVNEHGGYIEVISWNKAMDYLTQLKENK